jgi:DNA polymerase-3 subunit alpha
LPATMAAMIEGVQRRKTKRGKDFCMADFSDSSGQFSASCFEESLVPSFLEWARDGTCILLQVELDAPSPDEPPRITVRSAQPLAEAKQAARMELRLEIDRIEAIGELAMLLPRSAEATGEVIAVLRTGGSKEPTMRLGADFQLDSELVDRLTMIDGLRNPVLSARRGAAHLRLVA